jgi:hypothetical protein
VWVVALASPASAHDLVTVPVKVPSAVTPAMPVTPPEQTELEREAQRLRASSLMLDLRAALGAPLRGVAPVATGLGDADVAIGYLTEAGRYAGITVGLSQLDTRSSGLHETTLAFGVDLAYRFSLPGRIEPWLGLGFAWQVVWLSRAEFHERAVGPEFPVARIGVGYKLGDDISVGPFAAFAYRRYDPWSIEGLTPIELGRNEGREEWLLVGVSASFRAARF